MADTPKPQPGAVRRSNRFIAFHQLTGLCQALRLAVKSGYARIEQLETDSDLDPLREDPETRAEFQALVQQVRAKK